MTSRLARKTRLLVALPCLGAALATAVPAQAAPPKALMSMCEVVPLASGGGSRGLTPESRKTNVHFSLQAADPQDAALDEIVRIDVCLLSGLTWDCPGDDVTDARLYYDKFIKPDVEANLGDLLLADPHARFSRWATVTVPATVWDWGVEHDQPGVFIVRVNKTWTFEENGACPARSKILTSPAGKFDIIATLSQPAASLFGKACTSGTRANYFDKFQADLASADFDACVPLDKLTYFAASMDAADDGQRVYLEGTFPEADKHQPATNGTGHDLLILGPKVKGLGGISFGQGYWLGAFLVNQVTLDPALTGWARGHSLPLSTGAHERGHDFGSQWRVTASSPQLDKGYKLMGGPLWAESFPTSHQNTLCYEGFVEAPPDVCFSADRVLAEHAGVQTVLETHKGLNAFLSEPTRPALLPSSTHYGNGVFLRYVFEQFAREVGSTAHPSGTLSKWPVPPPQASQRLRDRKSAEGHDLVGEMFRTFGDEYTEGATDRSLTNLTLTKHLGRSLGDTLFDFHTAYFLKDYDRITPNEHRFHFTWAGSFISQTTLDDLLPFDVPADLYDLAQNGASRPDLMVRAVRQLDDFGACTTQPAGNVVCAQLPRVPFSSGDSKAGQTSLTESGVAALSIYPDPNAGSISFKATGLGTSAPPRFRIFKIEKGGVQPNQKVALTPVPVCGVSGAEYPPMYECEPSVIGGGWLLSKSIVVDADTDEILVVASASEDYTQFAWSFGKFSPELAIVAPDASLPALVGDSAAPKSFTLSLTAWHDLGVPYKFAKEDLTLRLPGCATAPDCTVPAAAIKSFMQSGASTLAVIETPAGFLPTKVPGEAATFLDLEATVDGLGTALAQASLRSEAGPPSEAVVFVMDRSGSMAHDDKMAAAKLVAKSLVDWLLPIGNAPPSNRLSIVSFNHGSYVNKEMTQVSEATRVEFKDAIDALVPFSETSIGNGCFRGAAQLARAFDDLPVGDRPSRQSMIVLSDGQNTVNDTPFRYTSDVVGPSSSTGDLGGPWETNQPLGLAQRRTFANALTCGPNHNEICTVPYVSAIAIGADADVGALSKLAKAGKGKLTIIPELAQPVWGPTVVSFANGFGASLDEALGFHRVVSAVAHGALEAEMPTIHVPAEAEALRVWMVSGTVSTRGLVLVSPSGVSMTPPDLDPSGGSTLWQVAQPEAGLWRLVEAVGVGAAPVAASPEVFVSASVRGGRWALQMTGAPMAPPEPLRQPRAPRAGEPLHIEVALGAGAADVGCAATTVVTSPSGNSTTLTPTVRGPRPITPGLGETLTLARNLEATLYQTGEGGLYEIVTHVLCPDGRTQELRSVELLEMLDADGNGLDDSWEVSYDLARRVGTGPLADVDGDGLSNLTEYLEGLSPIASDSDGGGESDASELARGRDPRDARDDQISTPSLRVVAGSGYVRLVAGSLAGLVVEKRNATGEFVPTSSVRFDGLMATDAEVEQGAEVCYRVRAETSVASSGWSTVVCATPRGDAHAPLIDASVLPRTPTVPWWPLGRAITDPRDSEAEVDGLGADVMPSGVARVRWSFDGPPTESDWRVYEPDQWVRLPVSNGVLWVQAEDVAGQQSEVVPLHFTLVGTPQVNDALGLEQRARLILSSDAVEASRLLEDSIVALQQRLAIHQGRLTACGFKGRLGGTVVDDEEEADGEEADEQGRAHLCKGTDVHVVRALSKVIDRKQAAQKRLGQGNPAGAARALDNALRREQRLVRWAERKGLSL